jgi:hypothetical protein
MIFGGSSSKGGNIGTMNFLKQLTNNHNKVSKTQLPENLIKNFQLTNKEIDSSDEIYSSSLGNSRDVKPNLETECKLKLVKDENELNSDYVKSDRKYSIGPYNSSLLGSKFENKKKEDENFSNFFKTKEIEFLYYQYLFNSFFQCFFCLTSVICAVLQYEWEYSAYYDLNTKDNKTAESIIYIANCICFITSIFLWIVFVYEHFITCKILYLRKNLPERIWRRKYEQITSLIFKLAINFLHPCPFFIGIKLQIYNEKFNIFEVHSLNSLMTVFCLLRLWCIFKFYLTYSDYYSPRSQRICQMNNFDTSLHYSMKANMTKAPQNAYLILFLIILGYCSYCLRIFERVLDEVSGKNFSSYWNTIWCLIITMTTVGYGDFFPSSLLGRLIGIMACTCGIFLISMLIVTISNLLELTPIEENVFKIIQRIKLTKEKDDIAAKFVTKYIKILRGLKKKKQTATKSMSDELLLGIHYLKEKLKEIDDTFPHYGENDILSDQLTRLDGSVEEIKEDYNNLQEQLNQIKEMLNDGQK